MCGLFGYRLHDNIVQAPPMWPVFASLVSLEMERRGTDGWGLAGLRPFSHEIETLGCAQRISDSLDSHIFGAFHAMILHTRAKTTGAHCVENNHPFIHDHIIGAHNGVVYNHESIQKQYQRTFSVDSQHIFAHLAEGHPLADLEMYGAIEFFNQRNPLRTYLMRCFHGSLYVGSLTYDSQTPFAVVWASTKISLVTAARTAGFELMLYDEPVSQRLYFVDGSCVLWDTGKDLPVREKSKQSPQYASCDTDWGYGYGQRSFYGQTHTPFRGHNTHTTPTTVQPMSLWRIFQEMKPLLTADEIAKGVPGHQVCRDCGVYYSLISVPSCLICGHRLSLLAQDWAEKRYCPAEPYVQLLLDQGRYTPPLPKKFVKKQLKLLDELLLALDPTVNGDLLDAQDILESYSEPVTTPSASTTTPTREAADTPDSGTLPPARVLQ